MRKLKPETIAAIQADKGRGATTRELADRYRLSKGSIDNALKAPASKAKAKAPKAKAPASKPRSDAQAPAHAPDEPMTRDELVSFLTTQARALRTDIEATTEPSLRGALNRQLVMVQQLLTRTIPAPPLDPSVGVFVKAEEMGDLGAQVRERLHKMVDLAASGSFGPPCPMCKRPVPLPSEVSP